ncbi:MAG: hypothetical protein KF699_03355 [Phycisphaeraceae bacterium]|nr:hypothetical protein [Phycisphaeraceae bacterium]MBX3405547.1 hypothetical protein [Phycisphaeraceae bacterium]
MLFTGHFEHTIDPKQRLAIPAKVRNQWDTDRDGHAWYCVPWPKGCLRLYTEREFKALAQRHAASLTPGEEEAELELQLFGLAERLEMDSAGRVAIPRTHLELTGLKSDVVVVGVLNRMEVWDRTEWKSRLSDRFNALPHLVARIEAKKGNGRPAGG